SIGELGSNGVFALSAAENNGHDPRVMTVLTHKMPLLPQPNCQRSDGESSAQRRSTCRPGDQGPVSCSPSCWRLKPALAHWGCPALRGEKANPSDRLRVCQTPFFQELPAAAFGPRWALSLSRRVILP